MLGRRGEELWKCRGHGTRGKAEAAFPLLPQPLGNLANRARLHIPTAWHRPGWKSGKPNSGFPLFHSRLATTTESESLEPKTKKGDRPHRGLLHNFQDHLVLETEIDFRIILGLENAVTDGYSPRKVVAASCFVARCAGSQAAVIAARINNPHPTDNVAGSCGVTP